MSKRIGKLAFFVALAAIPAGVGYYKSEEKFGSTILMRSLKEMEIQAQEENKAVNSDNSLHYQLQYYANKLDSLLFLSQVHIDRILNWQEYNNTCNEIIKKVINPVLSNYQKEKVFELKEIIIDLKQSKEFNNKLALLLTKIQQRNMVIKQDNKILLQRFYQLQQKLFTSSLDGITPQVEEKINILYDYFRQRQIALKSLLPSSPEDTLPQSSEQGLGWKLQYL